MFRPIRTYTGPNQLKLELPEPREASAKLREAILDRAYEEAQEDQEIRWLGATRIDPGCWDRDLDLVLSQITTNADGEEYLTCTVFLGSRILYNWEISFDGDRLYDVEAI